MKTCKRCQETKPLGAFFGKPTLPDGYRPECKACSTILQREYRQRKPEVSKKHHFMSKYNITLEHYEDLLEQQGGVCAVCSGVNANGYALSVDHDHKCCPGKKSCGLCIRGLLCDGCNRAEGFLKSDPNRAMALAAYLLQNVSVIDVLESEAIL